MSNVKTRYLNEHRFEIEGQIDLSAAAAVTAVRGTDMVVAKTATGTYTVTLSGTAALKMVEVLTQNVNFAGTVPATALGCRVSSITQTTNDVNAPIVITLKTSAAATSGADTDTTAATTLSFNVCLRVGKMGAWA